MVVVEAMVLSADVNDSVNYAISAVAVPANRCQSLPILANLDFTVICLAVFSRECVNVSTHS